MSQQQHKSRQLRLAAHHEAPRQACGAFRRVASLLVVPIVRQPEERTTSSAHSRARSKQDSRMNANPAPTSAAPPQQRSNLNHRETHEGDREKHRHVYYVKDIHGELTLPPLEGILHMGSVRQLHRCVRARHEGQVPPSWTYLLEH